jgi:nucleotide-binding universal stress UspA family protein
MTEFATSAAPARSGMRFKHILLLSFIAFAGGIGASWWLADSYGWLETNAPVAPAAPAVTSVAPPAPLVAPLAPSAADTAMAAGNNARAEGLLVAFAARRAIDNGTPLGYLTDQLRLRFGTAQPQAVITVLQASQSPVTLQTLQAELTAIENLLVTGSREETLWATFQREFSELFVLRKSDSPSPAPTQRMLRTHALVESGNIGGAIAEISAMPGVAAPAAQNWLGRARGYDQTRKALDVLERSALATPPALAAPVVPIMLPVSELPQTAVPE